MSLDAPKNRQAPIGVFDSGVGGLSILQALQRELPQENFVYIADSAHAPYGERDAAFVKSRAKTLWHTCAMYTMQKPWWWLATLQRPWPSNTCVMTTPK